MNDLLDELVGIDPKYESEIKFIKSKYDCEISVDIEKHNALQLTYYYEIEFTDKGVLFVEIESGINNGTQINHAEWGVNTKPKTKTVEVLKDIKLDMSCYNEGSLIFKKAQAVLKNNKEDLFKFHRQNSYDNYVTGGNSKMQLDPLLRQLQLEYVYEEKEVDVNFI